MNFSVGDIVKVKITEIKKNGCKCSFCDWNQNGFIPFHLMPSFFDVEEILTISKYSIINAAIHKIEKNGYIILSDLKIKEIIKQRISSKSKSARMKITSETFAIKHTFGSIFDSEVINVSENT